MVILFLKCHFLQKLLSVMWWISNVRSADKPTIRKPPDIVIESDSSLTGWGAINKSNFSTDSEICSEADLSHQINYLEIKAAFLALQHFCDNLCDVHVSLFLDNVFAIKYLSKLGGWKVELNRLTKEICELCMARNILLFTFQGKITLLLTSYPGILTENGYCRKKCFTIALKKS